MEVIIMEHKLNDVNQDNILVANNDYQCWWLYANQWKASEKSIGYIEQYDKYNKEGQKKRYFDEVKRKDKVVFYQSKDRAIVAVGEVDEVEDKQISFKITKIINAPIKRDILKNDVNLKGMTCFKPGADGGGSLFKVTKDQYYHILKYDGGSVIENTNDDSSNIVSDNPKNIILYGPPGTGKTYNTVRYAVALCKTGKIDGLKDNEYIDTKNYEEMLEEYNNLKENGRIVFTTFHQSYGYEEFIEGIKPLIDENDKKNMGYEIKPGIFKKFCDLAQKPIQSVKEKNNLNISSNPTVWIVLLDGAGKSKLKGYCFKNGEIRIGWGDCGEIITKETIGISNKERAILINFQDKMKIGDIVFVEKSRKTIDAIGIITGPSEFDKNGYEDFPRKRNVHWIKIDINENVTDLNDGVQLDRKTVYPLPRYRIDLSEVFHLINKYVDEIVAVEETEEKKEPFVFIIDEINRGNISKIFGELITLIESNKRLDADEAMSATLPYSGETFGIPDNVYIVGTMNTADRSIALIDTALRRRFHFVEMMPNTKILETAIIKDGSKAVNIMSMLERINKRIEYLYDREHTIGHGFFTSLIKKENQNKDNLKDIFKNKIIPLLQEYFYDDYKKIQLVLGDDDKNIGEEYKFVKEISDEKEKIFKGSDDIGFDIPQVRYEINPVAFENIESYIKIYTPSNDLKKISENTDAEQKTS